MGKRSKRQRKRTHAARTATESSDELPMPREGFENLEPGVFNHSRSPSPVVVTLTASITPTRDASDWEESLCRINTSPIICSECDSPADHVNPKPTGSVLSDFAEHIPSNDTRPHGDCPQQMKEVRTHPRYSFLDGSRSFQAENVLFRIHSHVVGISPTFSDLFPAGHCRCPICQQTEPHLVLAASITHIDKKVKAAEFEALMDLIYTPSYEVEALSKETYVLALPLSYRWGFVSMYKFIVSNLEKTMDVLERYILARRLSIPELAIPCLVAFVVRKERLTIKDGNQLGMEAVVVVSSLREQAFEQGWRTGTYEGFKDSVKEAIAQYATGWLACDG